MVLWKYVRNGYLFTSIHVTLQSFTAFCWDTLIMRPYATYQNLANAILTYLLRILTEADVNKT